MTSLPHLKNLVLQLSLGSACKETVMQGLLMSMSTHGSDITAAPEKFGFADLAGEFLPCGSVARAPEVDALMTSLPHLNICLCSCCFLLESGYEAKRQKMKLSL